MAVAVTSPANGLKELKRGVRVPPAHLAVSPQGQGRGAELAEHHESRNLDRDRETEQVAIERQ